MRKFRDYPIAKKLIVTFCIISAITLLISMTSLALTSWINERNRALTELKITAKLIGANSNAPLIFRDSQAARETLSTLRTLNYIVFAALYDSNGNEFARYIRDKEAEYISGGVPKEDRIDAQYVTVVEPIILDGTVIGNVVLRATLQHRWKLLKYNMGTTAGILVLAFVIAMLFAIALGRSITVPLTRLSEIMKRVSHDHDYSIRSNINQEDEVGVLASGIDEMLTQAGERDTALEKHRKELEEEVIHRTEALQAANEKLVKELSIREAAEKDLQHAHSELELHHHEFSLLSEMNDRLQVCHSVEETGPVVAHYIHKLFNDSSGGLYIFNSSRSLVEPIVLWGESKPEVEMFKQDDCWALRQGHPHFVNNSDDGLICAHCEHDITGPYVCIPMIAYGEVMGVLHLRMNTGTQQSPDLKFIESIHQLAITTSEHLSLALANLQLKEVLQMQSVRDPLTGLYNRRYMQESLEREIARCLRNKTMLGVIMLDIDLFKNFNDTYGHDVGDLVLIELGNYLKQMIRGEDVACRFGGEEFILILPGIDGAKIKLRAEEIRNGVKAIQTTNKGQQITGLTISLGIALYPQHGTTVDSLVTAADAALYKAKRKGRDQYVMAVQEHSKNEKTIKSV